jgi:hypothetical protein
VHLKETREKTVAIRWLDLYNEYGIKAYIRKADTADRKVFRNLFQRGMNEKDLTMPAERIFSARAQFVWI